MTTYEVTRVDYAPLKKGLPKRVSQEFDSLALALRASDILMGQLFSDSSIDHLEIRVVRARPQ